MHSKKDSSAYKDLLFLPADDILESLAQVFRSLDMNDWRWIDPLPSVQEGYRLVQACAQDPKLFKECIQAIGIALQIQDQYGYHFTNKYFKDPDFGKSYWLIYPDEIVSPDDEPLPDLELCENALYACHLFERLCESGLQDGHLKEAFRDRFKEVFVQSEEGETFSIEQAIRALFRDRNMLPNMQEITYESTDNSDITDNESYSNESAETRESPISELSSLSISSQNETLSPLSHYGIEDTVEYLASAYRQYEINGKFSTAAGSLSLVDGRLLVDGCMQDKEVLKHCLQAIDKVLQHQEASGYQFDQKYYPNLGHVYTLLGNPYLSFDLYENALYARDLFEQLYKHGYNNASVKETFQAKIREMLADPDIARSLPHVCAVFQKVDAASGVHEPVVDKHVSMTHSMDQQANTVASYGVLKSMISDFFSKSDNAYVWLLVSISISVLSKFIRITRPVELDDALNIDLLTEESSTYYKPSKF